MEQPEPRTTGIGAVIFDWAGTIVDVGCFAPTVSIVEAFAGRGVEITLAEARGPMGLEKKEHLRRLLAEPAIALRWRHRTGRDPRPEDAETLYRDLEPRLTEAVARHAGLVPGVLGLAAELRRRGIRIGSTTGYLRPLMDFLTAAAARQGFVADAVICPSDVPAGRPAPWMCYLNAISLGVYPPGRIVKIGDTPQDMREGVNAGAWTIGVTLSGNEVGLSAAELAALDDGERFARHRAAEKRLVEAGACYVVQSVAVCQDVLARIEERILGGEQPSREKTHEPA